MVKGTLLMRFDTLLVANRGEIACRVIRSAKAAGLRTVAVYSDADADAPHVALADEAVRIGPAPVAESYLNAEVIISAALAAGAGAIHPGYGFLSENADFARAVDAAGLTFVGPPVGAIEVMGDKARSKQAMIKAGVPCVPGYQGKDQSDERLLEEARKIGVPVMIKASAGGGGRGMRMVHNGAELADAIPRARSEALNGFGSDVLIIEKAVLEPRHVEIQVFADAQGNCVHLGERDCSVQRRHQKVVEEAPCPVLTPGTREAMGAAAVAAAQAVNYVGAGTVEFLLDDDGAFYFLEMNTRLQVEHPVTELVTGLDLVEMQLAVAQGEPLAVTQQDVRLDGHAIEVRLYAENPANDFLPETGTIAAWVPPVGEGIRVDDGVASGQDVSPFYDPMLAKIIASGPDRDTARQRLISALEKTACLGVTTNRDFLIDILRTQGFASGSATTGFIDRNWPDGVTSPTPTTADIAMGAALHLQSEAQAMRGLSLLNTDSLLGFASDARGESILDVVIAEQVHTLRAKPTEMGWIVAGDGWDHEVRFRDQTLNVTNLFLDENGYRVAHSADGNGGLFMAHSEIDLHLRPHMPWDEAAHNSDGSQILAPMPGLVVSLDVAPGSEVTKGQTLAVLESMKMQHQLLAEADGIVSEVLTEEGSQVGSGDLLVALELAE
jgi:geranyl-CoA carboxylase alpha subunit